MQKWFTVSGSTSLAHERIINGGSGLLRQHPHIASLSANNRHICGATIISSKHLITAAHCAIRGLNFNSLRVSVGSINIPPRGPFANTVAIKHFVVHEQYNRISNANDIALLVLQKPLELIKEYIYPAVLPEQNVGLPYGKEGTLTGWWVSVNNTAYIHNERRQC